MVVSLVQFAPFLNKKKNIDKIFSFLKGREDNFFLFPELSLNGYFVEDLVREDFFVLEEINTICQKFKEGIFGVVLKENNKYFNAAIYCCCKKVKFIHRKIKLPTYGMFDEARFFNSGDRVEIFDSSLGKSAILICEDAWDNNLLDISKKVDTLFILSASPARGFRKKLSIERKWEEILAKSKSRLTFFINRVGFEGGVGFWGGSRIIGKKKIKLDLFKEEIKDVFF